MFQMFNVMWTTIAMFFSAFGRVAKAADLAGQALEAHAAVMAEGALIHQRSELKRLNDHGRGEEPFL